MRSDDYTFDSDTSYDISAAIARKKQGRKAENKRARRQKKLAAGLCVAAVIVVLAGIYLGGLSKYAGKFLKNTFINDTDVSGMTTSEVTNMFKEAVEAPSLTLNKRGGDVMDIDLSDFGYKVEIAAPVREAYNSQNHALWFTNLFKTDEINFEMDASYDEEKLERLLRRTVWGSTDTQNASISYGDNGYFIVPEVYGDTADVEKLVDYVLESVNEGKLDIDLEESGCYKEPAVKASDLSAKLDVIKAKYDFILTYDFDYTQEYLTGAQVFEWTDGNGNIDRSKAVQYVAGLAEKYDTFMTTRHFKTTERGEMDISQGRYSTGQYGWWMDQEKTVDMLLDYIAEGRTQTIEPWYVQLDTGYVYQGFKSGRSANDDIGKTYIEIDLTAQHLWYYKDGELQFETTSIVSGKATDPARKTPGGIYSVYTKETNYMMNAADGSYRTRCSYFMRLSFEGIGLHDLSRGSYGGNTYINNGSHGCINMKYSEVKQLYEMVDRGTPCIMYY
ncbi:MAG: L,D-transpeptidase family protein [Oscillospiraceae bacterium]|nr:L,D-transpeptidase family protein [Oscillospiraceae bacterium]